MTSFFGKTRYATRSVVASQGSSVSGSRQGVTTKSTKRDEDLVGHLEGLDDDYITEVAETLNMFRYFPCSINYNNCYIFLSCIL